MTERPGEREEQRGPAMTALRTSIRGNATAFGFSITITISFGALQTLSGSPTLVELLLFGIGAAVAIGVLEGLVTRGFRARVGSAPTEVAMLGTALNALSVAAGLGAAILAGELIDGTAAWPIGAAAAATAYTLAESAEILLAEFVQRRRGDPDAEQEQS